MSIPSAHRFPLQWQPKEQAYACLEVADSGCGISDKDIENLFDPFFTKKFTGRGLGLPVVLGIVRAHGGVITVESEPGRGSIFRVFIPVSEEHAGHGQEKTEHLPTITEGLTLLLVEDEAMVRKAVKAMLMNLGLAVLEAKDGLEAVEVFGRHEREIACVICDLTMPRMNGWETLTALRRIAPGIRVILASGYNEGRVMEGHHAEQPQAFLQKPFTKKELAAVIQAVLAKV